MVGYLEVHPRVAERSSFLCSGLSKFLQGYDHVCNVSEDSVIEHWFYGINIEARDWLVKVDLIIKAFEGNSTQVFVICEPDQCTERQYNRRSITFILKESVN